MVDSQRDDYIRIFVKGSRVECSFFYHNVKRDFLFDGERSCSVYSLALRGKEMMDADETLLIDKCFEHLNDDVALKDMCGNTSCIW